jgi:hypothetical protein|tara:strand:- start:3691 stop:4560 length:870 start_codon:yes stop_codon:yes gene_type:complete
MDIKIRKVSTNWKILPTGLTWYFIGQPKTGKTTQASKWSSKGSEGVLLIDTDLGSDFANKANTITVTSLNTPTRPNMIDDKQITKDGKPEIEVIPNIERGYYHRTGDDVGKPMEVYSMVEVYHYLKDNFKELPYDTIAIDTIDHINRWIEQEVCDERGQSAMGEGSSWGADWAQARKKNLDILKRFQTLCKSLGKNLVIISHAKNTVVTDGKSQLGPELPKGLAYAVTASADVIGYAMANKEDGKFYISFQAYDERTVGSRLRPLAQKTLPFDYDSIISEILKYKEETE